MGSLERFIEKIRNIEVSARELAAMETTGSSTKTVVVKPHVSKTAEEAGDLASDWKSKERQQLVDNIMGALG